MVLAVDNSASVSKAIGKQTDALKSLFESIEDEFSSDFEIKKYDISGNADDEEKWPVFKEKTSPLADIFSKIDNDLENTPLKAVVFLSDGIYNKGVSPLYRNYSYPIYAIGIGDTTVPKDNAIKNCLFNNIVGKNNKFPISVEVKSVGFKGQKSELSLWDGSKKLASKEISFSSENATEVANFQQSENEAGMKHYQLRLEVLNGEFSVKNNVKDIYFEVIEAKQKIAIVAAAPHPDIKAIAATLKKNENSEVLLFIPGIKEFVDDKYDLVIFYQVPSQFGIANDIQSIVLKKSIPSLYILGNTSSINEVNVALPDFTLLVQNGQTDKVTGEINPDYSKLNWDGEMSAFLQKSPPVSVPFGEYNLGAGWETMMYQKVGTVLTSKPLVATYSNAGKSIGVIFGEGLWQWKLNEFSSQQQNTSFDKLINRLATLLAQKADKRKFRFYTAEKEFDTDSPVIFNTEVYNDIYESIYDKEVDITLKHESGKTYTYSYTNAENSSKFSVNNLPKGIYKYVASTEISGKKETATGEFTINSLDLEDQNTVADFELLRNLSANSGGVFYVFNDAKNKILSELKKIPVEEKVYRTEQIMEIINLKLLFVIILALLTFEWAARKYLGAV